MVFLELLVLVTVEFVVFLILKVTFLEKFCLLCSPISCLNVYDSELRQYVMVISDSSCNRVLCVLWF